MRSSRDHHRLGSRKAANCAEAVRLLIPFHAVNGDGYLRAKGSSEGAQIGRRGVAARVDVGNLGAARPAPFQRLRMIGFRQVAAPHRAVEGAFGRGHNTGALIISDPGTTQHDDVTAPRKMPRSHAVRYHFRDEAVSAKLSIEVTESSRHDDLQVR